MSGTGGALVSTKGGGKMFDMLESQSAADFESIGQKSTSNIHIVPSKATTGSVAAA